MRVWLIGLLGMGILVTTSCRRQDMRTVTIRVPGMKNASCAMVVAGVLQGAQGIPAGAIHTDVQKRMVTVTYDSLQRARKNIEFAIADAGFAADDTPANPDAAAKLPQECR